MSQLTVDTRIKFTKSITLSGPAGIVTVDVFGGPIILLQVAIFNAADQIIDGIGFQNFGSPASSEVDGTARWLFSTRPGMSYIKWGVVAIRSAAGLGRYSITGKVRDAAGNELVAGRFSAEIPDGQAIDEIIYDGVNITPLMSAAVPAGVSVV